MPKLKINDISMYYEIHGEGEPVVFISGFGADHLSWRAVIESFKENYQVILLDNRGAGQTDAPTGPYAIDQMADDVVQLCSNLGIKQAHFVGNSMGGFILQTIAYLHPHLVKSATISHSSATIHTCFQIYLSAQLELLKANAPLPSLIKASLCWVFSYQFLSKPDMLNMLCELSLNNPYPFTIKGYEGQLVAVNQFNSTSWLGKIHVPTLVLASDQDLIFREPTTKFLSKQIPNANYYCFHECGHLPMIEYPALFSQVVKNFILQHQKCGPV